MKKLLGTALLTLLFAAANVQAGKIQCWKDKDGNRMCGDRVPPEYAGQKREIIEDGRVVETKRGAKTPEEIAAEKRAAEEAEEARRRAEFDRSLLQSYRNIEDIENMRDERLAMLDYRIQQAQKSAETSEKALADLRARAEQETREGPKQRLLEQIATHEISYEDQIKAIERLTEQREETRQKYEADGKRYLELRPLTPEQAKAREEKLAAAEAKRKQAEKAARDAEAAEAAKKKPAGK